MGFWFSLIRKYFFAYISFNLIVTPPSCQARDPTLMQNLAFSAPLPTLFLGQAGDHVFFLNALLVLQSSVQDHPMGEPESGAFFL